MSQGPENDSHEYRQNSPNSPEPDLDTGAVQCSTPFQYLPHLPSSHSSIPPPATRYPRLNQHTRTSSLEQGNYFTSSQHVPGFGQPSGTAASAYHLERSRPRHAPLPEGSCRSDDIVTAKNYRLDELSASDNDEFPEPASKRCRLTSILSDDGWIERSLERAARKRIGPDESPIPKLNVQPLQHSPHRRQLICGDQHSGQPSPPRLGPPGYALSPGIRSATISRHSSALFSSRSTSHSPAPTHITVASGARRQSVASPPAGSGVGDFAALDIQSRSNSVAVEGGDSSTTFGVIHNVPVVELTPRTIADQSYLDQLPKEVFMRIMMFCGYKDQVLLKKCSYSLYLAVDLETIPWQAKTETILCEERYNPRNFAQKAPNNCDEDEDDAQPKKAGKRKQLEAKAGSLNPKAGAGKTKPHPDTYGRWGCYCCYKILPAYYFEGALLEEREGRGPKSNKLQTANAVDADKKVDMRVEYAQVLQAVPGRSFPDWLSRDTMEVDATDIEAYVRQRGKRGVNCDDLRAYHKDIIRETHLMAPIRGVTTTFTPSLLPIPKVDPTPGSRVKSTDTAHPPSNTRTSLPRSLPPAIQTEEEQQEHLESSAETSRSFYHLHGGTEAQGNADNSSYAYELPIPRGALRFFRGQEREVQLPTLPNLSEPVSKIYLPPPKTTVEVDQSPGPGDVVALRRVCILCGTKYGIYRRNCNRKIVSKTDEQWWPCDCSEVRAAGRSTGCSKCGRKVIY